MSGNSQGCTGNSTGISLWMEQFKLHSSEEEAALLLLKIADGTKLSEGKSDSKDLSIHELDVDYLVVEALLSIYTFLIQSDARPWFGKGGAGLVGTGSSLVPVWDISATNLPSGHLPLSHSKPFPVETFALA